MALDMSRREEEFICNLKKEHQLLPEEEKIVRYAFVVGFRDGFIYSNEQENDVLKKIINSKISAEDKNDA